jgi:hypothetical protein
LSLPSSWLTLAACSLSAALGCRGRMPPPAVQTNGEQSISRPHLGVDEEAPIYSTPFLIEDFVEPRHRILREVDDQTVLLLEHLWLPGVAMETPVEALGLVSPYAKQSRLGSRMGATACATARRGYPNRLYYRPNPRVACAAFVSAMFKKHGVRGYSFAVNTFYPQVRRRGGRLVATYVSTRYHPFFRFYRTGDLIFFHRTRGRFGHLEVYCHSGLTAGTSSSVGRVGVRRMGNRGYTRMSVVRP